jgi:hypothetical protein
LKNKKILSKSGTFLFFVAMFSTLFFLSRYVDKNLYVRSVVDTASVYYTQNTEIPEDNTTETEVDSQPNITDTFEQITKEQMLYYLEEKYGEEFGILDYESGGILEREGMTAYPKSGSDLLDTFTIHKNTDGTYTDGYALVKEAHTEKEVVADLYEEVMSNIDFSELYTAIEEPIIAINDVNTDKTDAMEESESTVAETKDISTITAPYIKATPTKLADYLTPNTTTNVVCYFDANTVTFEEASLIQEQLAEKLADAGYTGNLQFYRMILSDFSALNDYTVNAYTSKQYIDTQSIVKITPHTDVEEANEDSELDDAAEESTVTRESKTEEKV